MMNTQKAQPGTRSIGLTLATLSYVAFALLLIAVALLIDDRLYWLNAGAFQSLVDNAMPYVLGIPDRGESQPVELWTLVLGPLVLLLVATPALAQLDRAWLQWMSRREPPSGILGLRFDAVARQLFVREVVWRCVFAALAMAVLYLLMLGLEQLAIQLDPGLTALSSLAAFAIVMAIGLGNPGGAATVLGSKDGGVRFGYLAVLSLCCVAMFLVGAASLAITAFFAAREMMRDDSALGILLFVTTNPVYGIGYSATIVGMILVGLPFRV